MNGRTFTDQACATDVYAYMESCVNDKNFKEADMCNRTEIINQLCVLQCIYNDKAKCEPDESTRSQFMQTVACIQEMTDMYKHAHLEMVQNNTPDEDMFAATRLVDKIVDAAALIVLENNGKSAGEVLTMFTEKLDELKTALNPEELL